MNSVCGANCHECDLFINKSCQGCINTNTCPFGKKCWIANYIEIGGKENYKLLKKELIDEFNSLNFDGMSKINDLYPLQGSLVNLEYTLPNNRKIKYLNDGEIYLGNQVECEFNNDELKNALD